MTRQRLTIAASTAALGWLLATAAVAQTYICPGGPGPGEAQVGVQNGPGFNGVPVCGPRGDVIPGAEQSAEELAASYGPGADPMARKLEAVIELEKMRLAGQIKAAELERDPRYQRYLNGGWDYFQDAVDAKPGELCTAFFSKKNGYVSVTTPGGDSPNAYLTFWGPNVPKPALARRVRVTLSQTGDPPQTATAFNYLNPATSLGAIILAVPTAAALLDNMLDVHRFGVALDGRVVAEVEWTGGHAARDRLRACMQAGRRR